MDNSSRLAALKNRVRQGQGTSLVEAIANATKNNSQTPPTSIPQINTPLIGSPPSSAENNVDSSPKSPIIYSQIPSPQPEPGPPIISSGSVAGTPPPAIESSHFKKSTQDILDAIRKNRANKITTAVTETVSALTNSAPVQPSAMTLSVPLVTYQPVNTSVTTTTSDTSLASESDVDTDMTMIDLSTPLPSKHNKPPVQSSNTTVGVKRPLSAVSNNTVQHANESITITSSSSNSKSNDEPPAKRQKIVPTLTATPKVPVARPTPQITDKDNNKNSTTHNGTFVNAFSAKRKEAAEQPITNNTNHLRPEAPQDNRPEPRSDNSAMSEEEGNNQENQEERPKKQKKQRVIPGPAGALPQLITEDGKPSIADLSTQKPNPEKLLNSPVLIRSPKKDPNTLSADMKKRLEDEIDFRKGPWLAMLHQRELPPYKFDGTNLLNNNLRYVLTRGFASKVPDLVFFIKSVKSIDEDALVEVKDPTATAEATIHRELLDKLNQQPLQGSVLHVKSISVWSPPPARKVHHLVITAANLIAHYPVDCPVPEVPEIDTSTFSLLSSYNLKLTDAELEAKSPSKIARAAMPKLANSTVMTPKRSILPVAAPKTNGTSPFDMTATAAQPKGPMVRGMPQSPAPKAPPKYGGPQSPGPPKYSGAPKTPYRPTPQQNGPQTPGPSKTPYRPAPGPNQIMQDQSQTPVTPTRPNPPYNANAPTQSTPSPAPRTQVPFNIMNYQDNQPQPTFTPQPQPQHQPPYNANAAPQPQYQQPYNVNNNAPRPQQQPLRRSPQDFPQQSNNINMNHAPPTQPNNYAPQSNYPNATVPRFVNNTPQSAAQPSYAQPQHNAAQPRPYNAAPNNVTSQPPSATPINTNLPSQTPTSSMPASGLSHATSNLSGSISNFSRSGNNRFLAGMAANNVWGNPTLNTNNTTQQSTSGQILPDTNQRR